MIVVGVYAALFMLMLPLIVVRSIDYVERLSTLFTYDLNLFSQILGFVVV